MRPARKPLLSSFSILVISALIGLIGICLLPKLSVQVFSNSTGRSISIYCGMNSRSSLVTEKELTNVIESGVSTLGGIKNIYSSSGKGDCVLRVQLQPWKDAAEFRFEASAVLRQLKGHLPEGSSYPQIVLDNRDDKRISSGLMGYYLKCADDVNIAQKVANERVRPALSILEGVDHLEFNGGSRLRLEARIKEGMLGKNRISFQEVAGQLRQGLSLSGLGTLRMDKGETLNLSLSGGAQGYSALQHFPIRTSAGSLFELSELSSVSYSELPPKAIHKINGEELLTLSVFSKPGINVIDFSARIERGVAEINRILPKGYLLVRSFDHTKVIREELGRVYFRTALSIAILMFFVVLMTGSLRYLLIVVCSLALNLLVCATVYYCFNLEIRLYSLAGITVSFGMLVDNVIVIVEELRQGRKNKILSSVVAGTFTSLGALSVIFLLPDAQNSDLLDFAVSLMVNLLISLPIAVFFIPSLLDRLPVSSRRKRYQWITAFGAMLMGYYQRQLYFLCSHRRLFFTVLVFVFGIPFFLLPLEMKTGYRFAGLYNKTMGSRFFNENLRAGIDNFTGGTLFLYYKNSKRKGGDAKGGQDQDAKLFMNVKFPNGTLIQESERMAKQFEYYLDAVPEVALYTTDIYPGNISLEVSFKPGSGSSALHQLKQLLEERASSYGGAESEIYGAGESYSNTLAREPFSSTIVLQGYDLYKLRAFAGQVKDSLSRYPRVKNVIVTARDAGEEQDTGMLGFELQKNSLLDFNGISYSALADGIGADIATESMVGYLPAEYGRPGVEIVLLSDPNPLQDVWNLINRPVQVGDSAMVRLGLVGKIEQQLSDQEVLRKNHRYTVNVHYDFIGEEEMNSNISARLVSAFAGRLPFGYDISIPDPNAIYNGNGPGYAGFCLLVIMVIFMISAVLLESLRKAVFVVLLIPFSFVGVFAAFSIMKLGAGRDGYAALLLVAAMVSNIGMYILNDVAISGRHRPGICEYSDAIRGKLLPVLITTFSSILSLLPFLINGGEDGFWFTMSVGSIVGLMFSLLGIIYFLPVLLIGRTGRDKTISNEEV